MRSKYRTGNAIAQHPEQLPKFWQPKLAPSDRLDCKLTHWDLFERIATGSATYGTLWDWIETGYTYSQMMRLLTEDGSEFTDEATTAIRDQLLIYEAVIARFRATGRVGFNGEQLCIARAAAHIMDGLIDMDRHGIAVKAALWSQEQMAIIRRMAMS